MPTKEEILIQRAKLRRADYLQDMLRVELEASKVKEHFTAGFQDAVEGVEKKGSPLSLGTLILGRRAALSRARARDEEK
ncbi:MAG: hypothetical protein KKC03_13270 [Bacteroidetes bacterium]|nr:hypothetical protein [Bacteroidota bacterium]